MRRMGVWECGGVGAALLLAAAWPAQATREPTVPPVYYLIDYGQGHLDSPKYVEWVRELPPELLHLGKDVPMTHVFGPIAAVGGENQAHGRNRADIRRLTPAEVRERIAVLQRMNRDLHAAGAKLVMPYIAAITYGGNPDTREGFFDFYDHWNEYAEFGIGPKPATDPVSWAARKADGSFHTFGKELAPPYYAGMNRYVACIEHPDWRRWLVEVTRLVAVAGYDGAFPDNSSPIQCYAPHCQSAFAKYLEAKFSPAERKELFGTQDAAAIPLPKERKGLLWVEANRFWQTSLARHLHAMREGGRRANPRFLLFPNCGTPIFSAEYLSGNSDYLMLEGGGPGPEGAGCVVRPVIGRISRREVIDNILDYRYCADVPGDIRPMLLKLGRTPEARKLCLAEAAAFGSGAYNGARPGIREALRPSIEFLLKHKDLYAGKVSASRVALLFYPMRGLFPGSAHYGMVHSTARALGALQVPFDCFSETGLRAEVLQTYPVCVVAGLEHVADAELGILREYVERGGRLLLIGSFAGRDPYDRQRALPAWLPAEDAEASLSRGSVVRRSLMPTRSELLAHLAPAGEPRLVVEEGKLGRPMLRAMLYEAPGERVLHLLNYNCPVESVGATAQPEKEVRVRVPLPAGKRAVSVTCYDVDGAETPLSFRMADGACRFTVPEVPIYVVCLVKLEP